jgi:translation initiation factor 2A
LLDSLLKEILAMSCSLVVRGSRGLCLQKPADYAIHQGFQPDESKACKVFQFSHDGNRLAWSNMSTVQIASLDGGVWTVSAVIDAPKVYALQWSPLSSLVATWEQYSQTAGQEPRPNMHVWDAGSGEKVKSFFQKKFGGWAPIWTKDETICSRMVNNEVQLYSNNDFSTITHKIHMQKVADFSMSPAPGRPHVVTYVPGTKGGPSFCKLFQFPNFGENQVLANKSFFQADSVDMKWNSTGTGVLLLVQAEVDKTGASYYGKQQLHYMTTKGETCMVELKKEGPIYSVTWSPKGDLFAVVHGFMPAKSALFNNKGDAVFDFGNGPKNLAMFNPQSSILMIGGFGNLRGKIDMWDVAGRSLISSFDAPDTTDVKWNPDGQHIVTSTCAPRLRIGNGYKVWHYSGSLIHEKMFSPPDELWEADWQASAVHPVFQISKQLVSGIQTSQPQVSKQVYRPPGARGTLSTFKLHDEELPNTKAGVYVGKKEEKQENLSKTAQKNKKRREAAKKKKDEEEEEEHQQGLQQGHQQGLQQGQQQGLQQGRGQTNHTNGQNRHQDKQDKNAYKGAAGLLFDPEKEKKMKKIKEKLDSIQSLKTIQETGKVLEKNQLEKLSREKELLEELRKLTV